MPTSNVMYLIEVYSESLDSWMVLRFCEGLTEAINQYRGLVLKNEKQYRLTSPLLVHTT